MRDDRLREILTVGPAPDEVAARSRRARRRAIAAYDAQPRWSWRPAIAAGFVTLLAGVWLAQAPVSPESPALEERRIEMKLQLSDGTRVNWVMDDRYAL
jgi:hypothetical protein